MARDDERNDEQVDRHEVERKHPGGAADVALVAVLDDRHVELARQHEHAARRQKDVHRPVAEIRRLLEGALGRRARDEARGQIAKAIIHAPGDENADDEEGQQLDHRFRRDGEDQSVLMLRRLDVPRAKGHGETRQHDGDANRHIARRVRVDDDVAALQRVEHGRQRLRDRLQLQGDVGHHADHRDRRHQRRHRAGFAIARRHEIGDRGDVLRVGKARQPGEKRIAEPENDDRPEIGRQEVKAMRRGEADRAEKRPGRAINAERQRVDERPGAPRHDAAARRVGIVRDREERAEIDERGQNRDPASDHATRAFDTRSFKNH